MTLRIALMVSLLLPRLAGAQEPTLPLDSLRAAVAAHHPVARHAQELVRQADGAVLSATGAMFDPQLSVGWERKAFGDREYYNYLDAALKVPTPLGIDIKLGLEKTSGQYFAPDRRTPPSGLLSLGLSMPIGQGIVTDRRRAELGAARAKRDGAAAARDELLNALLLEATSAWAEWYRAERLLAVAREGVALAEMRRGGIVARVARGDLAAIDTIEVRLEVVRRAATLALAEADAIAARARVATYLWDADGRPQSLDDRVLPGDMVHAALPDSAWLARELPRALRDHPKVRKAEGDLGAAAAGRRQAVAELLPDLEGEVARLAERDGVVALSDFPSGAGNYKFGVRASTGLLLMKERGKAGEASAKGRIAELVLADLRRDIAAEAVAAAAAAQGAARAAGWQGEAVALARRLLDAEQRRFDAGESSLFLVNQRERGLLYETTKLADAEVKRIASTAKLATALGYPARLPEP
ncbi:MAG: TolC family protein [Gemmatimonadales bacterium]